MREESRETFTSAWGTILSTAGLSIGLGNIWRFPYMMGSFGGAAFLVVFLLILVAFGIPGVMVEWSLGRHTRRGPLGAYERAGMPGGRCWGYLLLFTIVMTAPYYSVVLGWVLRYAVLFLTDPGPAAPEQLFESLTQRFSTQFLYLALTLLAGCGSLYFGVKNGIEKLSKLILPLFFLVFAALIVRSLTLEGALQKLATYLSPRWDEVDGRTILAAMGQVFFSLGLGGTLMIVYGSYLREEENIPRTAVCTALLDTSASLMAAVIIVPAVLVFGIDMASGPSLMFVVLPAVFERLPLGFLIGGIFFSAVFLIALLSLMAAYEVFVAALQDAFGWKRPQSLGLVILVQIILAIPSMLSVSYLLYSDLIWGSTMQPVGGLVAVIALAWFLGQARALEEMRRNSTIPVSRFLFYWIKYVIPPCIAAALLYGWMG